jgi:hypothetical protein
MTPHRHGGHAEQLREVGHDPKVRSQRPAPGSARPYSHAIVAGGFVFCPGIAGIDPLRVLSVTASRPRPDRRPETSRPKINQVYAPHMPDPRRRARRRRTSDCPPAVLGANFGASHDR